AAAEDYINQTAAVELIHFEQAMNEMGDIVIVAHLRNVATRAINDVSLTYQVLTEDGSLVASGTTGITHGYVASGEGMTFTITLQDDIVYNAEIKLEITEGTWTLE